MTTMLTICNFWSSVNRQLPQVSYAKAVDYYFIVSFLFILLTLVEYTIVLNSDFDSWKKKSEDKTSKKDTLKRENSLKNFMPVSMLRKIGFKLSHHNCKIEKFKLRKEFFRARSNLLYNILWFSQEKCCVV